MRVCTTCPDRTVLIRRCATCRRLNGAEPVRVLIGTEAIEGLPYMISDGICDDCVEKDFELKVAQHMEGPWLPGCDICEDNPADLEIEVDGKLSQACSRCAYDIVAGDSRTPDPGPDDATDLGVQPDISGVS